MSDSVQSHRQKPTRLPCPWDSPGKNIGVGFHFHLQYMKVKSAREVAQSCLTLSDPMDCSLPGSSVHGIFHARVLQWVATALSKCSHCWLYYLWHNLQSLSNPGLCIALLYTIILISILLFDLSMCACVYVLIFTFYSSLTAICFGVKCREEKYSFYS